MTKHKRLQKVLLSDKVSDAIIDNLAYIINIMPEICYMIDFEHNYYTM